MTILFWFLLIMLALWYLGALGFAYHVFAFRYPHDITLPVLLAFLVITIPISLVAVGYLANFYKAVL